MTCSNNIPDKRTGSVDQQHKAGVGQPHEAGADDKQWVGHHQAVDTAGQKADRIFQWAAVMGRGSGISGISAKFQTRDE